MAVQFFLLTSTQLLVAGQYESVFSVKALYFICLANQNGDSLFSRQFDIAKLTNRNAGGRQVQRLGYACLCCPRP